MMNRLETFLCLIRIFQCQTTPILKTLGQFDLVFVIMSTRENIRLFASSFMGLITKSEGPFQDWCQTSK